MRGRTVRENVEAELADAAEAFRKGDADVVDALGLIAVAVRGGFVLPPAFAQWLADGIDAYLTGKSLDDALGLKGQGTADPRRKAKAQHEAAADFPDMFMLRILGADVKEAAVLVAALGNHSFATLVDRFPRHHLSKKVDANAAAVREAWRKKDVEEMLAKYPDKLPAVLKRDAQLPRPADPKSIKRKIVERFRP